MPNFTNRSIAGSAALIATLVTVVAATPLRAEPVSVQVAYGDLDLGSEAGASLLQARIARAARIACGPDDAGTRLQVAACRSDAMRAARQQLAARAVPSRVELASR